MSKKAKRDETVDKLKCISEIVAELVLLFDRGEKINLTRVENYNYYS
jgi:elongator complex protein 3